MNLLPPILADFEDALKVVIGIIVFIAWGIGALANLAKKQNRPSPQSETEMERAMREQVEEARRREAAQALGQMSDGSRPLPPPPVLQPQQQRPRQRGPAVPPMRSVPQAAPPRASVRAPAPPMPPPIRRPDPLMQPGRAQPKRQQPKKQQAQQRRRTAQAPMVLSELDAVPQSLAGQSGSESPGLRDGEIGAGPPHARPARRQAAAAPVLRLTAGSLRHQFILTEILQPPLALRDHPPGA